MPLAQLTLEREREQQILERDGESNGEHHVDQIQARDHIM
jgi:hypothetical protein